MLAAFENLVIDDLWKDNNIQIQLNDENKSRYEQKLEKICNRLMEKAKQHDPTYRSITKIKSYLKGEKTLNKNSNDFKLIFTNFNKYYSGNIPYTFERYQYFTLFFLKYFKTITQVVPKTANEYYQLSTNLFYVGSVKQDLDETITEKKIVFNNDNLEYLRRLCRTMIKEEARLGTAFFLLDYEWCSDAYLQSNDISYERNNLFFIEQFKSIFDKDYYSYLSEFESEKLRCFSKQSIVDDLYEVFISNYFAKYKDIYANKYKAQLSLATTILPKDEVERLFFYFCFIYCSCNKEKLDEIVKNNGIDLCKFKPSHSNIEQICKFFKVDLNDVFSFYYKQSKNPKNATNSIIKSFGILVNSVYEKINKYEESFDLFSALINYKKIPLSLLKEKKLIGYYFRLHENLFLNLLPNKLRDRTGNFLIDKLFNEIISIKLYIPSAYFYQIYRQNNKNKVMMPMLLGESIDTFTYCALYVRTMNSKQDLYILAYDRVDENIMIYLVNENSNQDLNNANSLNEYIKSLVSVNNKYFSADLISNNLLLKSVISAG